MLISHSHDGGDDITSHIKDQLDEADKYRETSNRNAITITNRFRDLHGLQLIMEQVRNVSKFKLLGLLVPLTYN